MPPRKGMPFRGGFSFRGYRLLYRAEAGRTQPVLFSGAPFSGKVTVLSAVSAC